MPPSKILLGVAGADAGGDEELLEVDADNEEDVVDAPLEFALFGSARSFFFFLRIPGWVHVSVSRFNTWTSLRRLWPS
jgi:hypothetical protein